LYEVEILHTNVEKLLRYVESLVPQKKPVYDHVVGPLLVPNFVEGCLYTEHFVL
jgi:hypothetical protein